MSRSRIFYDVPDFAEPSWGIGLLYRHVELLRREGFDAFVLHRHSPFRLTWLESEAPVRYRDQESVQPGDFVVVPEVAAAQGAELPGRRIVFVQGSFLIPGGLGDAEGYGALGYEHAMATLPEMARLVQAHFGVPCSVVPPAIDDLFFAARGTERSRRVLIAFKEDLERRGLPDRQIVERIVSPALAASGGELRLLRGLGRREVAELLAGSDVLVNLNVMEGLNATVVEAMAGGCLVVCYDAIGPRDYLRDGENAMVFANHDAWRLAERVVELLAELGSGETHHLEAMREEARRTAEGFRSDRTRRALVRLFGGLVGS